MNGFGGQVPEYQAVNSSLPQQILGQPLVQSFPAVVSFPQVSVSSYSVPQTSQFPFGLNSASLPPPLPIDKQQVSLPVKHNSFYNVNPILAKNILNSRYFQSLFEKTSLFEVKEEINAKVEHIEPFVTTVGSASNTASTAFCLLYKLFTMRLSKKQLSSLISAKNTSFVRALGFLYLRYILEPTELWEYFEEYLSDETSFCPYNREKNHKLTIGEFVKKLLSEQKYFETLLPRIPKPVEVELQVKLLKKLTQFRKESENLESNLDNSVKAVTEDKRSVEFEVGEIVEARYSVDGKWYEAEVLQILKQQHCAIVKYSEYEGDNTETVHFKHLRKVTKQDTEDSELRDRILEKQRQNATAATRSEYSKKIVTFKRTISVPLNPKSVSKELNELNKDFVSKSGEFSLDDILKKKNRNEAVDKHAVEEELERERKRKQRKKELEKIYGNEANKKPKTH